MYVILNEPMEVSLNNDSSSYRRIDRYDPEKLAELAFHYEKILTLLGEDVRREGWPRRPRG